MILHRFWCKQPICEKCHGADKDFSLSCFLWKELNALAEPRLSDKGTTPAPRTMPVAQNPAAGRHYPWLVLWPGSGNSECFSQVPFGPFSICFLPALFTKGGIHEQFSLILDPKDSAAWAIKIQFGYSREKETNICAVIHISKNPRVQLVSKRLILSLLSV